MGAPRGPREVDRKQFPNYLIDQMGMLESVRFVRHEHSYLIKAVVRKPMRRRPRRRRSLGCVFFLDFVKSNAYSECV